MRQLELSRQEEAARRNQLFRGTLPGPQDTRDALSPNALIGEGGETDGRETDKCQNHEDEREFELPSLTIGPLFH